MTDQGNITTRRALLATLAVAPALGVLAPSVCLAATPEPEDVETDPAYSAAYGEGYAAAMETVAFAWLQRWTEKGGSAYMGKRGKLAEWDTLTPKLMISYPTYHFSPVAEDNADFYSEWRQQGLADLSLADQDRIIADRARFDQYFHEGKVKELADFIETVPDAYDAIERIVENMPGFGTGRARKVSRFSASKVEA
jgi:hypothetical protein